METPASFGEWLRARRKALDLTQLQLAEQVGCAEDTIGRIEAGTRRPSRQVAALLAGALDVPSTSHADFIRFAREGGSGAALDHDEIATTTSQATQTTSPAPPVQSHVAWTPFLSSVPQPPTPLIGREAELKQALGLLRSRQARLLTLTGPPGVGKTRLATALALALTPAFPDGICFVSLAPLRDPELLTTTVIHALGLSGNSGGPQAARLLDFLRHKRLLLVLDNFEQILAATGQVGEWLANCAQLQLLVTSRSALHLRGERLFPVFTLAVPPALGRNEAGSQDLKVLGGYASVSLFIERAQAIDPLFRLTESNVWTVGELCRRMEGLPLAIELAAARSALLAPELVLARLGRRLDVVMSGPRDLPDHQRTLRTAIEWSYNLLSEPERLLFARMSVYAGGATLDALEAICNAREDLEGGLAGALEGLLQQSLVYRESVESEKDIEAGRRFNMLEMLREYAWERLQEWAKSGDEYPVGRYHAEYYLAMAGAAELQKQGAEQDLWLNRLERDHDNLRAAIQWAIDSGDMEMAARLCGTLCNFWNVRGYLTEGRKWLGKVLARPEGILPITLAKAMNGAGLLARGQGEYLPAISMHERSLAIFREEGDKAGMANCLNNLAVNMFYLGRTDESEALLQECLELRRSLGDTPGVNKALHNLGVLAQNRGDNLRAISLFKESLAIDRALGDKSGVCYSLFNIGLALMEVGGEGNKDGDVVWTLTDNLVEAESYLTEGLALARDLGNKDMAARSLAKLGEVALQRSGEPDFEKADALLEESLAIGKELGDKRTVAIVLDDLGFASLLRGDHAHARTLFEESLELSRTFEDKGFLVQNLRGLAMTMARVALGSDNRQTALDFARRAAQLSSAATAIKEARLIRLKSRYYAATLDELRGMLSQAEVDALESSGQSMSIAEVIALAQADQEYKWAASELGARNLT